VRWAGTESWINTLKRAIAFVVKILDRIYGQPASRIGHWQDRYMTTRAWVISAWIGAVYIFAVMPSALAIIILTFTPMTFQNKIEIFALFFFIFGLVAFFFIKNISGIFISKGEKFTEKLGEYIYLRSLKISLFLSLFFWLLMFDVCSLGGKLIKEKWNFLLLAPVFPLVIAILYIIDTFTEALARFAFKSPYVIVATSLLSCLVVLGKLPLAFHIANAISGKNSFLEIGILPEALSVIFACNFFKLIYLSSELKTREINITVSFIFMMLVASYAFGIQSDERAQFLNIPILFILHFGTIIIAYFGLIFSNSLPDWVLVALNRRILEKALQSITLSKLLKWAAIDILVVPLSILSTLLILFIFFAAEVVFQNLISSSSSNFSVNSQAYLKDYGVLEGIALSSALSIVGSVAILPPIFNSICMIIISCVKLCGILLGPVIRYFHGLLLLDDKVEGKEDYNMALIRSSAIFGTLAAILFAIIISIINIFIVNHR
jgi:hypothetical protein